MDESVIGDAARFDPALASFFQHRFERRFFDLEGDMQIEVMLRLEVERHVGCLEERQIRMIVELVESMQRLSSAPALRLLDFQRAGEPQAEEVFIKLARLLGIAAAVSVVMQFLDHIDLLYRTSILLSFSVDA